MPLYRTVGTTGGNFMRHPFHLYHIFPLGALRTSETINPEIHQPQNFDNLESLIRIIPHMKKLHLDSLLLGPIFQSDTHGYDPVNLRKIDVRIGSWENLKTLVGTCHKNGIRVILDAVFNHTSRNHKAYSDLQHNQEQSVYTNWYQNIQWNCPNYLGDSFTTDCWNNHQHLPKLNLTAPEVKREIFSIMKLWIEDLEIDGIRLDAADDMNLDFLSELSDYCHSLKNSFWMLGEVVHGDYRNWLNQGKLDSVTHYEGYKSLWSSFNDFNFFEIAYSLNRLFHSENGIYKNNKLLLFNENHDVSRIASTLNRNEHLYPLQLLHYCLPGVPSLYYGEEFGFQGEKRQKDDWNLRPSLSVFPFSEHLQSGLTNCIQKFIEIRKDHIALQEGDYREIFVSGKQIAFLRSDLSEKILVIINSEEKPVELELEIGSTGNIMTDLLNRETSPIRIQPGKTPVLVASNWGCVFLIQ